MVSNVNIVELTGLTIERPKAANIVPMLPKDSSTICLGICMQTVHQNKNALLCGQCRNQIHIKYSGVARCRGVACCSMEVRHIVVTVINQFVLTTLLGACSVVKLIKMKNCMIA